MTKSELRRAMMEQRRGVAKAERDKYSRIICAALLKRLAELDGVCTVAVYLATDDEISLDEFIAAAPPQIRFAAPRWDAASKSYRLAEIGRDATAMPIGHYGIREPLQNAPEIALAEIDLWIVPGLAFTENGQRLGYGGGYYDRFLSGSAAHSIAVAYPFQIFSALPVQPHDVKIGELLFRKSCT